MSETLKAAPPHCSSIIVLFQYLASPSTQFRYFFSPARVLYDDWLGVYMLSSDMLSIVVLVVNSEMGIGVLLAWMLSLTKAAVSFKPLLKNRQQIRDKSRHDGCCGTVRYSSLFHCLGKVVLGLLCEEQSLPLIGLGSIPKPNRSTTVLDCTDHGTADDLIGGHVAI